MFTCSTEPDELLLEAAQLTSLTTGRYLLLNQIIFSNTQKHVLLLSSHKSTHKCVPKVMFPHQRVHCKRAEKY